jgi:peptidoglycan-associated lipoprotein
MKKALLAAVCFATLSGCATRTFVGERMAAEGTRLEASIADAKSAAASNLAASDKRADERHAALQSAQAATSKLAQDALGRANAAHKLAEGKLVSETVLTDDQFKFAFGSAKLSKQAQDVLTEMASKLKADNKNVYLEIQGHTDVVGSAENNLRLGQERADAVRRHLHKAGIPLHRIHTVSYGKSQPVAQGLRRAAHTQNRRVVVMVLV